MLISYIVPQCLEFQYSCFACLLSVVHKRTCKITLMLLLWAHNQHRIFLNTNPIYPIVFACFCLAPWSIPHLGSILCSLLSSGLHREQPLPTPNQCQTEVQDTINHRKNFSHLESQEAKQRVHKTLCETILIVTQTPPSSQGLKKG